jgi:Uma2 family endonuclease
VETTAMSISKGLIGVDEYLASIYRPDMDYIDGVLEERNVGEKDHSIVQRKLIRLLPETLAVFPEVRIQISPSKFRVPDIAVYETEPDEQVFRTPPFLVIEILSPEDRMNRMMNRVHDYHRMGTKHIWIVDPYEKRLYEIRDTDGSIALAESSQLTLGNFTITSEDVFGQTELRR